MSKRKKASKERGEGQIEAQRGEERKAEQFF